MSVHLDPSTCRRAKAVAALLASDKEGERHAAMSALDRLMPPGVLAGLVTQALDHAPTVGAAKAHDPYLRSPRKALTILGSGMPLTAWERDFLKGLARAKRPPTLKQMAALDRIGAALAHWEARHG